MKNRSFIIRMLVLSVIFSSCTSLDTLIQHAGIQRPSVQIRSMQLTNMSFQKMDLLFHIQIFNPNNTGVQLAGFDYRLDVNQKNFLQGKQPNTIQIPSRGTEIIQLPVSVSNSALIEYIQEILNRDSIACSLSAGFQFNLPVIGDIRIPAEYQDTLPVLKIPEISVKSLQLERLNLDGADLVLKINIRNKNNFQLDLTSCNYQLNIENNPLIYGKTFDSMIIGKKADNQLPLGIHLNLVNAGKSLYRALRSETALNYTVNGHIQFTTSVPLLDNVILPYNESGTITFTHK